MTTHQLSGTFKVRGFNKTNYENPVPIFILSGAPLAPKAAFS